MCLSGSCGKKARARAAAAAKLANRRVGQAAGAASNLAEISASMTGGAASGDMNGAASTGYGNYIYAQSCPEGIDQDIALLATAAALAVGIYVVYRHATYLYLEVEKSNIKAATFLGKLHYKQAVEEKDRIKVSKT